MRPFLYGQGIKYAPNKTDEWNVMVSINFSFQKIMELVLTSPPWSYIKYPFIFSLLLSGLLSSLHTVKKNSRIFKLMSNLFRLKLLQMYLLYVLCIICILYVYYMNIIYICIYMYYFWFKTFLKIIFLRLRIYCWECTWGHQSFAGTHVSTCYEAPAAF